MKTQRFILFILCATLFFSTISSTACADIEQPQTEPAHKYTCNLTESNGKDISETMDEYNCLTQGHIAGEWENRSVPTYHQQGYREQHCVVCYELLNAEEIPALSRYDTAQLNGHSYKVFDESVPWTEAEAICESLGGRLVTITSQNEMQFIINLMNSGHKSIYWMGFNRDNDKREWRWVSGEVVEYTNWRPGEPNDANEDEL